MFGKSIETLHAEEMQLEIELSEKRRAVEVLEVDAGEVLLDNPEEMSAMADRSSRAHHELRMMESKVKASVQRRQKMNEDARQKQAATLRGKASRARDESAAIVKRVSGQLAKIAEVEGLTGAYDISVTERHAEVPKHVKLLMEAETDEAEARRLEGPWMFAKPGRVSGMTALELYQKCHVDPTLQTPTLATFERVVAEQYKAALTGVPPATGFASGGGYMQLGGFSKLSVENRGLIYRVEYTGGEITGATFELAPLTVPHANLYGHPGYGKPKKDETLRHFSDGHWTNSDGETVQPPPRAA